ncbi:hypothetical protein H6CHR_01444 [Variovorax sp. PBL-H6]|uniref:hypothetical protein n=1 Tax=Variovorax sp. PBL-H6 TaxID=434009 RepID=UPI001318D7F7|nr:hypothetical protein [Variovorax sp. PBL-H6]VTU20726.1 hypothetical protein H6CHR_01444 [Variovorax sp. PBL-H6]
MRRLALIAAASAAVALLAACGEKPQTNAQGVKYDAPPWSGTSTGTGSNAGTQATTGTAFTASGWNVGDKNAWQQHLKVRTQNGQNDYTRDN